MSDNTFYVTTPIYYPSAKLHIGNAYSTVLADTITRYKKMRGFDTYFLTGSDEHGQKIERAAEKAGVTPKQYVDAIVEGDGGFKPLWKNLSVPLMTSTSKQYKSSLPKSTKRVIFTSPLTPATIALLAKPSLPICN